jgi:hypothetical protein
MGAFQIVAGWWRHQPGQAAVVGVLTDHNSGLYNFDYLKYSKRNKRKTAFID